MFSIHKRSEVLILLMLILSLSLYGLEYLIFGQVRDIGFGFLGNLAFLPIYVLFVTFMIERILKQREKDVLRQKMNMVIGVFFSEVGTPFLKDGFGFLVDKEGLAEKVKISAQWGRCRFQGACTFPRERRYEDGEQALQYGLSERFSGCPAQFHARSAGKPEPA